MDGWMDRVTAEIYAFDVISVGQRSSPWSCNSVSCRVLAPFSLRTTYVATNALG